MGMFCAGDAESEKYDRWDRELSEREGDPSDGIMPIDALVWYSLLGVVGLLTIAVALLT